MLFECHRSLTLAVAKAVLGNDELARTISEASTFPDYSNDILVTGVGHDILGAKFERLCHFQIPYGRTWRGYAWPLDTSLPFNGPDLPDRRVLVWGIGWGKAWGSIGVPFSAFKSHPVQRLLDTKGYTDIADEMTWPCAASFADWLAKQRKVTPQMLGAILHFAQDACVTHHVHGVLLRGHSSWEGRLQDQWFGDANRRDFDKALAACPKVRPMEPRRAAEAAARATVKAGWSGGSVPALVRAIRYSAAVVRWWRER